MRILLYLLGLALIGAPASAQTALTCYKAVAIGSDSLSDTHPVRIPPLSLGVLATRATITVYTDSTYSMVFTITGRGRTSLQTESGKVRIVGSSQYGRIIGLMRYPVVNGAPQPSTRVTTFLSYDSAGRLKQRDSGLDVFYETLAGACPQHGHGS